MHEPTRARMEENYAKRGIDINAARLRMATLPTSSEAPFWSLSLCLQLA